MIENQFGDFARYINPRFVHKGELRLFSSGNSTKGFFRGKLRGMILFIIVTIVLVFIAITAYWVFEKTRLIYPLPKTVSQVDLKKYTGSWYEIALIPNRFEKDCSCTKATYSLAKNYIKVENSCYKKDKSKYIVVQGKAWPANADNSELKVQFFWPFKGDYWILYVDKDYRYALVGEPSRKYLWILARKMTIPKQDYAKLIFIAKQQGFATDRLVKTIHNC